MFKKILLVSFLSMFLFAGIAQAQTNDLPKPGLLPDSPFYFLENWSESIGTFFTFNDAAKAERFLNLAEERLAEINALIDKGRPDVAEKAVEKHQEQLNQALTKAEKAKEKGLDTDEVLAKVSEVTLKHQEILADVYEKVPEQAQPAIERAMQAGMQGHERALEAVSEEKREEVKQNMKEKRQEVEQRLEKLRNNKGIPIPAIPTQEEIEGNIPEQPEVEIPEVSDQPEIQEQQPEVEEIEVNKPEIPDVETDMPENAPRL